MPFLGAAVAEWLSSWLAEQEVGGSILRLATWISEIGYLPFPSRDMAEIPLKRRKSSIQPTTNLITFLMVPITSSNSIDKWVILGGKVDFSQFYQIFSYFF